MHLDHIPLENLSISTLNMRHSKRAPDVSDILPSIRKRGVLVPLLVRPNGAPTSFEIVAGRRRYFAAETVADEQGHAGPLPCAILQDGDAADAIEASLIENLHQDPDPMTQYEAFAKLIRAGAEPQDVAVTFGLSLRQVQQRMALANLLPKIREAFRREELQEDTVRHLTLATKKQQQEWLKLYEDDSETAPRGQQLKMWLFGGASIPTAVALFPLDQYPGRIIADLFGEDSYFEDRDLFQTHQSAAIAARRDAYLAAGWPEVVILDAGQMFESWAHEKTPKRKGGKVYIAVSHRGEVTFHEGYLTRKEVRRTAAAAKAEGAEAEAKPEPSAEVTGAMQTYIDLHRHAAVRAALLDRPGVALRLLAAHAMCGSRLWKVASEPQRSGREDTDASVTATPFHAVFLERKAAALALLDLPEGANLVSCHADTAAAIFARLLTLSDADVRRILTVIMADSLEAGSVLVEAAGVHLGVNMAKGWTPDEAFFDLVRDKAVVSAIVAEVAGKTVANGNVAATGKVQKQIIRDCLDGTNGRAKVMGWLPRWMQFPVRSYRKDGGLATLAAWKGIKRHFGG